MIWLSYYHSKSKEYLLSVYNVPETGLSASKIYFIYFLSQPYKMGTTVIIHFMDEEPEP